MPRLRHVDCAAPGLTRRRAGRGFVYVDEKGRRVRNEAVLERIRSLVIPPAWRDVWICRDANGHLQAVGTDDAGRRQYLYHELWRAHRDRQKFEDMLAFAEALPRVRRRISRLLAGDELSRDRVLGCAVGLLDRGLFRVGGEEYVDANGSYGLATLERRHVTLAPPNVVVFDYEGKTGKRQVQEIADRALYCVSAELKQSRRRDPSFLAYKNGHGFVDVRSSEINAFVKELAGETFSAKDFRTWHATVLAAVELAGAGKVATAAARERAVRKAVAAVSSSLGNTPAVCRASYIDPRVIDRFAAGATIAPALERLNWNGRDPVPASKRTAVEAAVVNLLGPGSV